MSSPAQPRLTYYYAPGACSLAPHILLHEAGLTFDAIAVAISPRHSTFPKDFRRLNPKMKVPVLVLNEDAITEVPAIETAISSLAPDRHLMGRTPMDTVRVYEWTNWLSGTVHNQAFGHFYRPHWFTSEAAGVEGVKAKALKCIGSCFDLIEEKLGGGRFAVGGALTAVDAFLFVFFWWGIGIGFEMEDSYPKYAKLVKGWMERAAVRDTLKAEGIEWSL